MTHSEKDATPDADAPAAALEEVWNLLDNLPVAGSSAEVIATTLEMAAVPFRGRGGPRMVVGPADRWRTVKLLLTGTAVVIGSLLAGLAAGRITAPDSDAGILAHLPVVQHVDLLRELGSVSFLEEVARRGYSSPRRMLGPPWRTDGKDDAKDFDAAIAALQKTAAEAAGREVLAVRREEVLGMADPQRQHLERAVETFQRLRPAERRDLVALGRALGDPRRQELVAAARLWHRWVQLRDPVDRRDLVELGTADRLECLEHWTRFESRNDGRGDGRESVRQWLDRERDPRRRPPPEMRTGPPVGWPGPPFDRRPLPEFRPVPPKTRPAGPAASPPDEVKEPPVPPREETAAPPR